MTPCEELAHNTGIAASAQCTAAPYRTYKDTADALTQNHLYGNTGVRGSHT